MWHKTRDDSQAATSGNGAASVVILDGAMGTELEARGAEMEYDAWSARANISQPELVRQVHVDYIRAGAGVITANTFSALEDALIRDGMGGDMQEINRRGIQLCLEAREAAGADAVVVSGAISAVPIFVSRNLPTHPHARRTALLDKYRRHAFILAEAGAEVLAVEMIITPEEGAAAIEAALETGLPVWAGVSCEAPDGQRELMTPPPLDGESRRAAPFRSLINEIKGSDVAACMVMHTPIEEVVPALDLIAGLWDVPLGTYPHHGHWDRPVWVNEYLEPPEFARHAELWIEHGARWVGGCCGIGPEVIEHLARRVKRPADPRVEAP
jgi:S-methylmethionine-dependent homocysteine/selenocysteine methylase